MIIDDILYDDISILGGAGETRKFLDTLLQGNNDRANFGDIRANSC
jgi:hypothetical protein